MLRCRTLLTPTRSGPTANGARLRVPQEPLEGVLLGNIFRGPVVLREVFDTVQVADTLVLGGALTLPHLS